MKMMMAVVWVTATAMPGLALAADGVDAALWKPTPYKAALNAYGQPNLGGVWANSSLTHMERDPELGDRAAYTKEEAATIDSGRAVEIANQDKPTDTKLTTNEVNKSCEVHGYKGDIDCGYNAGWTDPGDSVMRVGGQPRTSFVTFPANGRIPAPKPGAVPKPAPRTGGDFDNPENRSLGERCILAAGHASPVLQNALYNNNYQIVQSKGSVALLIEQDHDVRVIPLGAKHRADRVRPYMGDSIGHYEGGTLVVETTNFPQGQALRGSWQNLKVTEKFTRVAADRLLYQFKVEDPTVWDQAWGGEYELSKTKGQIYEYACHEGNYALEAILAGARYEEQTAKDAARKPVADAR
jgi:hypothetical protein